VIGGDFNLTFSDAGNQGYALFADVIDDFELTCCDTFYNPNSYTYHHDSLGQASWIDHFVIYKSLIECVDISEIFGSCENISEKLPITCSLKFPVFSNVNCHDHVPITKKVYKDR
jgi:hypothetical protein